MNKIAKKFETRKNGYWAQVGDEGLLFQFEDYKETSGAYEAALAWYNKQIGHTDPTLSREKIENVLTLFGELLRLVSFEYPVEGKNDDFFFYLDDFDETIVCRFGSVNVRVNDQGLFGAEMIVNWLTKEPVEICSGLTVSSMAEFLKGAPGSRSFKSFVSGRLHLDRKNVKFIDSKVKLIK